MKKIILIGYMGSGKSTIAKLLSKSMHYEFLDLDEIIKKSKMHLSLQFLNEKERCILEN